MESKIPSFGNPSPTVFLEISLFRLGRGVAQVRGPGTERRPLLPVKRPTRLRQLRARRQESSQRRRASCSRRSRSITAESKKEGARRARRRWAWMARRKHASAKPRVFGACQRTRTVARVQRLTVDRDDARQMRRCFARFKDVLARIGHSRDRSFSLTRAL